MKSLLTSNRIQLFFQFSIIIVLLAGECFGSIEEKGTVKGTTKFRILTEESPPYNFTENGKIKGISTEIVREILKNINHPDNLEVLPWTQGYNLLQKEDNIVLFSTTRSPIREDLFKWVGPLMPNHTAFFAKKGSGISISNMDDAKKVKSIGVYKDDFGEHLLKKKGFKNLDLELDDNLNIKKLAEGKIDLWIANELTGKHMIMEAGLSDTIEKVYEVQKDHMYIAFSKSTPDSVIEVWQNALDIIKADGTFSQIFQKWIMFSYSEELKPSIKLSDKEKRWLDEHPVLRVANEMDWPPFDFAEDSKPKGYSIDLINLIAEKTGLTLEFINGYTWPELLGKFKAGEIDIMPAIYVDQERKSYIAFTDGYYSQPSVIVVRNSTTDIHQLSDLYGKKLAIIEDYSISRMLAQEHPKIHQVPVKGIVEAVKAVSLGEVDAFIDGIGAVTVTIEKNFVPNIKIISDESLKTVENPELHIGVSIKNILLRDILNKGLNSISLEEMKSIRQKWISVAQEHTEAKKSTLTFLWQLTGASFLIFIVLFFLIRFLMKYSKEDAIVLQYGSRRFRMLTIITLSFIVTAISFVSWFAMKHNKEIVITDIQNKLETILMSTSERLDLWANQQKIILKQLGRDQEFVAITERLLAEPLDINALLTSSAQSEAREFFEKRKDLFGEIGFFIINPNYISIASKRDTNIGTRNLIAVNKPHLLEKVFQGEAVLVPPIYSDVNLRDSSLEEGSKKTVTMLFAAPIQKANGEIIAVVTKRVNPAEDFSKVMQFSRVGETGESYAFNKDGKLLSESRFCSQLSEIGLLKPDQTGILNIEIRDPGGNMVEGYKAKVPRQKQPLTLMASRAIQDQSGRRTEISPGDYHKIGTNIEGYRDYRGVPVFGAWLWEEHLDVGLAVEIDVKEALSTYHTMRLTVIILLGVTLFLFVGTTLFTLISGESTNRILTRARDELEERVKERTAELVQKRTELENVNSIILRWDPNGKVLFINEFGRKLFGFSEEEIVGKHVVGTIVPITDSSYQDMALITDGILSNPAKFETNENENICKNGDRVWIAWRNKPLKNDDGSLKEILTIGINITERKEMEEQLQQAYLIIEAQKDRMEKELNVGREIQMSMLPLIFPAFPDRKELDVYAVLESAREVGGDFYDFFFLDDGRFCFVIGDVSGKGVPSALFMAVTKTLIKSRAADDSSTASILTHVNEELSRDNKAYMFVTVFMSILNTVTGEMQYTNAGHNPPYILRKDGSLEALNQRHGPVIGAVKGLAYKEDTTRLLPGDMAYLYTDGVTEAKDHNNSLFTEKRLEKVLSSRRYTSTEDLVKATVEETKKFEQGVEQADDITVMAVEYYGMENKPETQHFEITIKNRLPEIEKVVQGFDVFSNKQGLDVKIRREMKMVFDEMLNNIISYAFQQNEEHEIEIRILLTTDCLTLVISDDGSPFNPFGLEAPDTDLPLEQRKIGGMGIHLVRKVMDDVLYQRKIEKNVVTLTKSIKV